MEILTESKKILCSICLDDICAVEPLLGGKYKVTATEYDVRNIVCPKLCHHFFHRSCIEDWVRLADTCPGCVGGDLRNSLVYFDDFANKYTKYLNNEINWGNFSPSNDTEYLYPRVEPYLLKDVKDVAIAGALIAFLAIPTYILALNIIEAKKRVEIAGGVMLINLNARITHIVALNMMRVVIKGGSLLSHKLK